jgi:hypothetical protein
MMGQRNWNTLATQVRDTLLKTHREWADYVDVLDDGDLELAVPAPPRSRAGHLVVLTSQGKDIWIRYAHPHMCYAVDSLEEMHAVIGALLADDAFFVVVTRGDEWIETMLLRPGQEPVLVEGQVANIVSWYGNHDKVLTFMERRPSKGDGGA